MTNPKHRSFIRKEGSPPLQEVVLEWQSPHPSARFQLVTLKVTRTPNCHKIKDSQLIGCDYAHYVFWQARSRYSGFCAFGNQTFPDTQQGLNEACALLRHIAIDYGKERFRHPKHWNMFRRNYAHTHS